MSAHSEATAVHARVSARSCEYNAVAGRHISSPRAVLDDDPAILDDDSEDGLEGSGAFVLWSTVELAHGCFPVTVPLARMNAGLADTHATLIDSLCRFQC